MALVAKTPFTVIVLISAWIPAPPLESLPAMVSDVFIVDSPSYIISKEEDERMQTADYQSRIVQGIADGVDAYFTEADSSLD